MKRHLSGALALAVLLLTALLAAPASAADGGLTDPLGDSDGSGLDIVGATLHNNDARLVVDVDVARSVRGDLIVSVDGRHGRGLRLVSKYRPIGHTRNIVVAGAFTDRRVGTHVVRCRGFRARWSAEEPTVRLILPSRCLHGGDYGALRFAVLTERVSDTDFAPEGRRASDWVRRG